MAFGCLGFIGAPLGGAAFALRVPHASVGSRPRCAQRRSSRARGLCMEATASVPEAAVSGSSVSRDARASAHSASTAAEIKEITARPGWHVHKFGGTSLATPERIESVARLMHSQIREGRKLFVVLSAVGGVTNKLVAMVDQAARRDKDSHFLEGIEDLRDQHESFAERLLDEDAREAFLATFNADLRDIRDVLRAIWIARTSSERLRELVMGYGELWSTQLVWGTLRSAKYDCKCSWMDARDVLLLRDDDESRRSSRRLINWEGSSQNLKSWLDNHPTSVVLATGFIARMPDGVSSTLGRNGSDHSATCFASMLRAAVCEIWTDVDGVYSADPRQVPDARLIDSLSYKEASELAYFGAKVLHPDCMSPLVNDSIPLRIRNSYNPEGLGTLVREDRLLSDAEVKVTDRSVGVKGFSIMNDVALINVEGAGMIGVPGIAGRMFNALFEANVSCIFISQASSEYSICCGVSGSAVQVAKNAIQRAFRFELEERIISAVTIVPDVSILALVGENMQRIPGVASRLFQSLSNVGISAIAMAQGSSERNLSVVVRGIDAKRALQAAHSSFYLSRLPIAVGIIGPGLVGGVLLLQIQEQADQLAREFGVQLQVHGITTSSKMLLSAATDVEGINLSKWKSDFEDAAGPSNMDRFVEHLKQRSPHVVLCDCTASEVVSGFYENWLSQGLNIVTPNKKANSSSMQQYKNLRRAQLAGNHSHFFYEANVGAGLPVISTMRDLLRTGDKFLEIEGIFSGTLSYIFNEFDGSRPFSEIVGLAKEQGYTEPDPRDDLSGMDVARKVCILAREIGLEVELDQVPVKSLVPDELAGSDVSIATFMERLPEFDGNLAQMASEAAQKQERLRYVGVIDAVNKKCRVELRTYPETHPFGALKGSDNIVLFRTVRYDAQPLTIRGPGAGAAVTAAGVFGDVLRLAAYLGAPSAADL
ncbi:Bifunctional aspartokinase/homoserine dehydrogenase 2, chloroplastic [Porphyridium purpureum]|uniref:Bifunctional aspartokinase/homoserine dehydrogenase 2, chloroplastic n=1 Tax=Porphyridium purpureum TaxID=35688 RepID=A0A5J4Z3Q1_PORPP|nr:Bifunctional aspartokinase/homoserine dehydrogenase 2, chloroplastic [Porphyridium purpureum]|eukprot:POR0596..scf295_1